MEICWENYKKIGQRWRSIQTIIPQFQQGATFTFTESVAQTTRHNTRQVINILEMEMKENSHQLVD